MMLFEYMIGNTDMSIWALHNVRLVQKPNRTLTAVPYDFDLSGFVHAPYAMPDRAPRPAQRRRSAVPRPVPHRRRVRRARRRRSAPSATEMLALVDVDEGPRRRAPRGEMKEYLEAFFRSIDKPASIKKTFVDGCKPQPTM